MNNLAFNYGNQRLWDQVEKLQVQVLETGKKVVITANVPSPVVSLCIISRNMPIRQLSQPSEAVPYQLLRFVSDPAWMAVVGTLLLV